MKTIIFEGFWTIGDVRQMSEYLFIFGDNDQKKGKKGQAIIRDEPNTMGIPTKKAPNFHPSSFYTDAEYEQNIKKIDAAIQHILETVKIHNYKGVVLPANGFGTGLAKLSTHAPKTLAHINTQIKSTFGV